MGKKLLFEAFVNHHNGPTYFYYVEKDDSWYRFKFGISMLGVVIQSHEDNRLNIISKSEEEYNEFKKELYSHSKQYRWYGCSFKECSYFNFLDENSSQKQCDVEKFKIPFSLILSFFFESSIDKVKDDPEGYHLIDKFTFNTRECEVIHDKWCAKPQIDAEIQLTDEEKSQILFDFICLAKDNDVIKSMTVDRAARRGYNDLMQEALYIKENGKYPEQMIVVEGWTAKDLIEGQKIDLIDAYDLISCLRENQEVGRENLRKRLYSLFPYLFNKEIEAINKARREAELKKDKEHEIKKDQEKPNAEPFLDLDFKIMLKDDITPKDDIIAKIYQDAHQRFLSKYTIPIIQKELKQYILGQDELVKHTATFIYYHILRQVKPDLSMRPLLISGPSGSGKTEVWRVAQKLYSDYLHVEIIDGSSITQDGWSGQRKLHSCLYALDTASILVVDEFDKLATPSFNRGGENVSHHIQSEFLKLLEGDYNTTGFRRDEDNQITYDTSSLGIVLVGAFEHIRNEKEEDCRGTIGFIRHKIEDYDKIIEITDEDLIDFGVLPELVGRVSDKCTTNKLTAKQYMEIIKNQHSKVNTLIRELNSLGISTKRVLTDKKILELAEKSQTNMLGVRWVSAQVESILLDLLIKADLRDQFSKKKSER